ncbi:MAG TPA: NAD(P)-dependent oxidoreductase [Anaerolineae bacterium]|nr:NAD(P)-dependent oxidoreductase [Anaerolineae bacterium]
MISAPRIGFIGLGLMGKPIAGHLVRAGYRVTVHNRSRAAVDELIAQGGRAADNPKGVAAESDVVITMLPDSPDVEAVAFGEQGILAAARPGMIHVDMSTIAPAAARRIAEAESRAGVENLDAPVSGGDVGAKNATLTIMVGGKPDVFQKCLPIFETLGKKITLIGDHGAGQIAKACNQIMVAAQMVAMGELLVFAQKAGADPREVVEAIKAGAAQCWTLDTKPQRLFAGNRAPGFKSSMMLKDLNIIVDSAKVYGIPLPMTAVNAQLFAALVAAGQGDLDNSAVIGVIEELARVKLSETRD